MLLETRQEARDLAGQIERGAERSGGDLFTAVSLEQETLTYIDSVLRQRQIVQTLEVTDKAVVVPPQVPPTEPIAPTTVVEG